MGKYIKVFDTHTDYESFIKSDEYEYVRPNISYCIQESEVHYNENPTVYYSKEYLTYEILNDNTNVQITISKDFDTTAISYISYSTDNGNSWTTINNEDNKSSDLTHSFVANSGDYIMWRAEAQTLSARNSSGGAGYISGCKIQCDNDYNILGNIMSLLYGDNFYGEYSLADRACCFAGLFGNEPIISAKKFVLPATILAYGCYLFMFEDCTSLTTAPELPATTLANNCYQGMFQDCTNLTTVPSVLPATILANNCYSNMFHSCTSLTVAPELPATTLAEGCYQYMFYDCSSLTTVPELPATTLAENCYYDMFQGCTSLTVAPKLPATTLAQNCYQYMFSGCTSLASAPELPATILAISCYQGMFNNCTSLTTAPALPAITLANSCYGSMFKGCTSLNYIKAMFTTTPSMTYTSNWVSSVAASGTFIKNAAATWNVTGVHGVPNGWTIRTVNK